jgi:hypothetical protein
MNSFWAIHSILRKYEKEAKYTCMLHPFRVNVVHKLYEYDTDHEARLNCVHWCYLVCTMKKDTILFPLKDENWFKFSRHTYSSDNEFPPLINKMPLLRLHLMCGVLWVQLGLPTHSRPWDKNLCCVTFTLWCYMCYNYMIFN